MRWRLSNSSSTMASGGIYTDLLFVICIAAILLCHAYKGPKAKWEHDPEDLIVKKEFDLKPGAEIQSHEVVIKDCTCRFTFYATGDAAEDWKLSMFRDYDYNEFICTAERPSKRSNLYFRDFKLEILNEFYGFEYFVEGDDEEALDPSEYKVSYRNAYVVHHEGYFRHRLTKCEVMAKRREEEPHESSGWGIQEQADESGNHVETESGGAVKNQDGVKTAL